MITKMSEYLLLSTYELAKWLDEDPDYRWSIAGDRILCGNLKFPCTGSALAQELRWLGGFLEVFDRKGRFQLRKPIAVTAEELTGLIELNEQRAMILRLRWKDSDNEWLLSEDK